MFTMRTHIRVVEHVLYMSLQVLSRDLIFVGFTVGVLFPVWRQVNTLPCGVSLLLLGNEVFCYT